MKSLLVLTALLAAGCFAELNAGYYKTTGGSTEKEFIVGLNAGLYLEYSRFIRVGAGGDAQLPLSKGKVYQRAYGTTIKGDLTIVGNPKTRLRLTGAAQLGLGGDTKLELVEGGPKVTGDAKLSGWYAGIGIENTHMKTRVTQQFSIGPHFMTSTSDVLGDVEMKGVQFRASYTFWPVFRSLGCGFFGCLMNMMANNHSAGESIMESPSGGGSRTCSNVEECTYGFNGRSCLTRQVCD